MRNRDMIEEQQASADLVSPQNFEEQDCNEESPSASSRAQRKVKIFRTAAMYAGFFSMGFSGGLLGPAFLDFELRTRSSTDQVAYLFTVRSIGGLAGTILAGVLIDRLNRWMLLGVSMLLLGAVQIVIPWCINLVGVGILTTLSGIMGGFYDAGGNVNLLHLWGKESGPWMQALHFMFGVGILLSPLLAEPFLAKKIPVLSESQLLNKTANTSALDFQAIVQNVTQSSLEYVVAGTTETPGGDLVSEGSTAAPVYSESRIMYPYLLTGIFNIIISVVFFVIYFTDTNNQEKKPKTGPDDKQVDKKNKKFFKLMIAMVFVFYLIYGQIEMVYGGLLMAFSVKYLDWSKTAGATATSAFFASFTVMRGLSIFIANWVSAKKIILCDLIFAVISLFPLLFWAKVHVSILWVCSIGLGASIASVFPSGMTWVENYVRVTGGVGAVFMIGASGGEMVGPVVMGYLFEEVTPMCFIYMMFSCACFCLVFFVIMCFVGERHGQIEKNERDVNGGDVDCTAEDCTGNTPIYTVNSTQATSCLDNSAV